MRVLKCEERSDANQDKIASYTDACIEIFGIRPMQFAWNRILARMRVLKFTSLAQSAKHNNRILRGCVYWNLLSSIVISRLPIASYVDACIETEIVKQYYFSLHRILSGCVYWNTPIFEANSSSHPMRMRVLKLQWPWQYWIDQNRILRGCVYWNCCWIWCHVKNSSHPNRMRVLKPRRGLPCTTIHIASYADACIETNRMLAVTF